ncbi:MAG TPA: C25 family cysteine peptidase, partial [Candidatus Sabulitectum sp.]|nr:C25 family cysteine peptidase [Candidatus Sabulitectum sp.]
WEECSGLPDMLVGRLPVRDTDALVDIFALIEGYEAAATSPYPENLQNRRFLTRLAGTDHKGSFTRDFWFPSVQWTTSLCDWMEYSLDSYYCGDGEDTSNEDPSNPDGSSMTSEDWVDACTEVFERGSQVAYYTDHGDIHMFSAGMNWEEGGPSNFGIPDSTFDDKDVCELSPDADHWFPFVLMLCCGAGTFNHSDIEHDSRPGWQCLCSDQYAQDPYDFSKTCLAEEFILNTDCGAIGVFAGSNSSYITCYRHYGEGILAAIYEKGITRLGDAVMSSRLQKLDFFYNSGDPIEGLAQFNLLGDPALDIGDRMKFRDHCDLIICPGDIAINAYPTMAVNSSGTVVLSANVRNAGWLSSGPFTVTMEVSEGSGMPDIITSRCDGLAPGEEARIEFEWNNTWFNPPGALNLSVSASDPGGQTPDSWMPNNSAEIELEIVDFYPNNTGWPISVGESVVVPPVLCDFDGNPANGLEIVLATRDHLRVYADESPESPVWESDEYPFFIEGGAGGNLRETIPAAGNILGDDSPEIVIDCRDELLVFNNSSTDPVLSLSHTEGWFFGFHSVSLGDFADEADFGDRDEIVLIRDDELIILDAIGSSLVPLRTRQLPEVPGGAENISSWSALQDINHDGTPEIIVRAKWNTIIDGPSSTRYFTYDYDADSFISQREWSQAPWATIPAVGELPSGFQIAIPTDESTSSSSPAWLVDPDNLLIEEDCESNPTLDSDHVPFCVMADWDPLVAGADRVIANTENQCYAWNSNGRPASGYPRVYSSQGTAHPPFPALGELDDQDSYEHADVLIATAEGIVLGLSSVGDELQDLGFPYTLPSSIQGGFAVADIDRDGKVEVVFGTMDNYLHVWELGSCTSGYAPWPQCQHDAARTGVLVE